MREIVKSDNSEGDKEKYENSTVSGMRQERVRTKGERGKRT